MSAEMGGEEERSSRREEDGRRRPIDEAAAETERKAECQLRTEKLKVYKVIDEGLKKVYNTDSHCKRTQRVEQPG